MNLAQTLPHRAPRAPAQQDARASSRRSASSSASRRSSRWSPSARARRRASRRSSRRWARTCSSCSPGSTTTGGVMGGFGSMPTLTWDDLDAIRTQAPAVRVRRARSCRRKRHRRRPTTRTGRRASPARRPSSSTSATGPSHAASLFGDEDVELGRQGHRPRADGLRQALRPRRRPDRPHRCACARCPSRSSALLERKGQSPMGTRLRRRRVHPDHDLPDEDPGRPPEVHRRHHRRERHVARPRPARAQTRDRRASCATATTSRPHDEDDFTIRNLTEIANAQQQGTKALTGLLAAIAVVSLIVGGIGIMNIMLVSVTERTREIGVRMAVGAKPWHILAQFLVEAMTLSMAGGLIGVARRARRRARASPRRLGWPFATRVDMIAPRVRLQRARRRRLRPLPGAQGLAARSHRGAPLRVAAPSGRAGARVPLSFALLRDSVPA